jgi:hypothetical protein
MKFWGINFFNLGAVIVEITTRGAKLQFNVADASLV